MFLLHNVPGPYIEFSGFAKLIKDREVRRKAEQQRCWLRVDLIHRNTSNEDGYRFIQQVLAKLAPADTAFLVHPGKLVTIAFDDALRCRLASGESILSDM
ncbi:MAG TPA: hypothetical protein VGJ26_15000 [Pirellulales bacterium]|jgi:hypothetical protein